MAIRRINGFITGNESTQPDGQTVLPYKCYAAILNQHDEYDPVATVLHNDFGEVVWRYYAQGIYELHAPTPVFKAGKRVILTGAPQSVQAAWCFVEYTDDGISQQDIRIECMDAVAMDVDNLIDQYIEIRIYE